MPTFLVQEDTFISHLGKTVRAGERVTFELPTVTDLKTLKPAVDAKGRPVLMSVGKNLKLIKDDSTEGSESLT